MAAQSKVAGVPKAAPKATAKPKAEAKVPAEGTADATALAKQPVQEPTEANRPEAEKSLQPASEEATDVPGKPADDEVTCGHCRKQLLRSGAVAKGGKRYFCQPCHATCQMLLRHGIKIDSELGGAESLDFFQKAKEQRVADGGSLSYTKVRALVKQSLCMRILKTYTEAADGVYKPLSMWARDGLDETQLKNVQEEAPWREDKLLGKVYCVEFQSVHKSKSFQEAEEKLLSLESTMRKRKAAEPADSKPKKSKGQSKGQAEEAAAKAEARCASPALEALQDLESDSEEAGKKKGAKPDAGERRLLRQEEKRLKKLFLAQVAAAAKHQPRLEEAVARLDKAWAKLAKSEKRSELPQLLQESSEEVRLRLEEALKDCGRLLTLRSKGLSKLPDACEAVVFESDKDLQLLAKEVAGVTRSLHDFLKPKEAK